MTGAEVTAAYPEFRAGRRRYVVVLRAPSGKACRHHETPSLHEAWRIVRDNPHHPDLTVRLPEEETR